MRKLTKEQRDEWLQNSTSWQTAPIHMFEDLLHDLDTADQESETEKDLTNSYIKHLHKAEKERDELRAKLAAVDGKWTLAQQSIRELNAKLAEAEDMIKYQRLNEEKLEAKLAEAESKLAGWEKLQGYELEALREVERAVRDYPVSDTVRGKILQRSLAAVDALREKDDDIK